MMTMLRGALERLGWPVDELDDDQIMRELAQRWFVAGGGEVMLERPDRGLAARAIYSTLAEEGNLDALCWSTSRPALDAPTLTAFVDAIISNQQSKHERADAAYVAANRRRSARVPRSELVDVVMDYGEKRSVGWLVDVSSEGAAYIMETESVPSIGEYVETTIHDRHGRHCALGTGRIVRTEMLSNELGLVCVELENAVIPMEEASRE